MRHYGGTYETLINYLGPGGTFNDVVQRYQTRIQAIQGHVNLEQHFAAAAAAYSLKEEEGARRLGNVDTDNWALAAVADDVIASGVQFEVKSVCCEAKVCSDDTLFNRSKPISVGVYGFEEPKQYPCFCSACMELVKLGHLTWR